MALEDHVSSCPSTHQTHARSSPSAQRSSVPTLASTHHVHVSRAAGLFARRCASPTSSTLPPSSRPSTSYQRLSFYPVPSIPLDLPPSDSVLTRAYRRRRYSCPGRPDQRQKKASPVPCTPSYRPKLYRWHGQKRTDSDWDVLCRDPELWFEDADCHVHLHARGASCQGPSFLIPLQVLQEKRWSHILDQNEAHSELSSESQPQTSTHLPSTLCSTTADSKSVHIFFAPPEKASREESFKWRVSTRNFFAFLLDKPLVGENMGQALVDLQERLHLLGPGLSTNRQDFLDYACELGYRDLVGHTDLALANLFYAEYYKMRDIWIDAFAHCVGMYENLAQSPEFPYISKLTKALIVRARREVDTRLKKVKMALENFLDEDFSPTYLGLTPQARNHLDQFRVLLHDFYTAKCGCWPLKAESFPKALYKSMHKDFKTLYDYLVDTESTTALSQQKPASGGICVLQNIISFDKRHNFHAQPHPLPILPAYSPPSAKPESQPFSRQRKHASQYNKTYQLHTMNALLAISTNTLAKEMMKSKILETYMRFERGYALNQSHEEEKLSAKDARKVRWLLVYGMLQYLESALRAPKEVRDTESPDYPLCSLVNRQATWNEDLKMMATLTPAGSIRSQALDWNSPSFQCSPSAIQPDCQREDYFSSASAIEDKSTEGYMPGKYSESGRPKSLHALGRLSLSARSSRRSSLKALPKRSSQVVLQAYGDGSNIAPSVHNYSDQQTSNGAEDLSQFRMPFDEPSTKKNTANRPRTPLLDLNQLDHIIGLAVSGAANEPPGRSDSTGSTCASIWSREPSAVSSQSSTHGDYSTPPKDEVADDGGLLGGFVPISDFSNETPSARSHSKSRAAQNITQSLLRRRSRPESFYLSFKASGEEIAEQVPPPLPFPTQHPSTAIPTKASIHPEEDPYPFIPTRATNRTVTAPPTNKSRGRRSFLAFFTRSKAKS